MRTIPRRTPATLAVATADAGAVAGFRRKAASEETGERIARLERVVAAAQRHDCEALRWLYLEYKDNLFGYVCSIVGDEHEAEDVVQQVFARLLRVIGKYQPREGHTFAAWLMRLSRNVAIDHLRRRRDTPSHDFVAVAAGVPEPQPSGLQVALDVLPAEQRDVILLRHVVGLSPGEIAVQMGRTEASIHGLHHRGRRALCRELERQGSAPATRERAAA